MLLAIPQDLARPEATLRQRAAALTRYLSDLPLAVLVANDGGRYFDANEAAVRLTGYPRAELLRLSLPDLTPAGATSRSAAQWRAFLKRGRMAGEFQLRRKDGRLLRARYSAVANVLRGVHVSALAHPSLRKQKR